MLSEILRDEVTALAKSLGHPSADQRHLLVVVARRLASEDEEWHARLGAIEKILPPPDSLLGKPEVVPRVEDLLSQCTSKEQMAKVATDLLEYLGPRQDERIGADSGDKESGLPMSEAPRGEEAREVALIGDENRPPEQDARPVEDVLGDLDNLIGLGAVKATVRSLVDLHRMNQFRADHRLPTIPVGLHLAFVGNPGTGKTTVARLVAETYRSLGLLSSGHLVEAQRADLVAPYVGQTALKVEDLINRAKGGVLFIDEAYSLAATSDMDYGHEALATLVKMMEDHRDNLAVIVAGYEGPMATFMAANPGLRSRFQKVLRFSDMSAEELLLVFQNFAADHSFSVPEDVLYQVNRYIQASLRAGLNGNARMVRSLFEEMYVRMAVRADADGVITEDEVGSFELSDVPPAPDEPPESPGMYL